MLFGGTGVAIMEYNLKIDEEFRRLIPPLLPDERRQLEESIVRDGCREPICVWNATILDGHTRYEICTRLGVHFSIAYVFLKNREAAVAWICANQLGHQNIPMEARRYLIGKRYIAERKAGFRDAADMNQYNGRGSGNKNTTEPPFAPTIGRVQNRLATEYNISGASVARYGSYAQAVDALSKIEPGLHARILSGETHITCAEVIALSRLSPLDMKSIAVQFLIDPENAIRRIKSQRAMKSKRRWQKVIRSPIPTIAIKETPVYDPDAAVTSLFFTIPSWIGAIERAAMKADDTAVSDLARNRLNSALRDLIDAAQIVADRIKEALREQ